MKIAADAVKKNNFAITFVTAQIFFVFLFLHKCKFKQASFVQCNSKRNVINFIKVTLFY